MIKSINYSQEEIIQNIIDLYLGGRDIECDPTYSKGVFYKGKIKRPALTFDIAPQDKKTSQADCRRLPFGNEIIDSIMFDPPFIVGGTKTAPSVLNPIKGSNITHKRFSSFSSPRELFNFYDDSIREFSRILKKKGVLIFKCQDQVSGGKQYMIHNHVYNAAKTHGFEAEDLFILLAKSRMTSGKWTRQLHARKYHCYFWVFIKK